MIERFKKREKKKEELEIAKRDYLPDEHHWSLTGIGYFSTKAA